MLVLLCVCMWLFFFFFFKQKTAYEMRISDWSSDVCSSDLTKTKRYTVSEDNVAEVVSMMTGIPVQRVGQSDSQKLLGMADSMKGRIIGQDDAVKKLVKAIQRTRAGLKDPKKPIGSFLFHGPTGVGNN